MVFIASVSTLTAAAAPPFKLGVMGDSLSDEYFEDSTRAYAQNWLQQLAEYRAVDPGPTAAAAGRPQGTWGPPRNTGYAYNWATAWVTARSLLDSGQATGLASQIVTDGINCAVLAVGANDFAPYSAAYAGIYGGTWSAARIRAQERITLANIRTALVTVRRTGVPLILVNILDSGTTPSVAHFPLFADAAKRQRVTGAISEFNGQLRQLAQTYQIPLVDWFSLEQRLAGSPTNLVPVLLLGNTPILMQQTDPGPGPDHQPTAGYVADGFHPQTTIQGVLANTIIAALNTGYGADVPFFSEAEILEHGGLPYGGSDTLLARIGAYSNYVFLPVPFGPTGAFRFTFPLTSAGQDPATNWSVQVDFQTTVNARNALPKLVAVAQLVLPSGETIVFPAVPAHYSLRTGYSLVFQHGTNVTVHPALRTAPTSLTIRHLTCLATNGSWHASSGTVTYRQGTARQTGVVN